MKVRKRVRFVTLCHPYRSDIIWLPPRIAIKQTGQHQYSIRLGKTQLATIDPDRFTSGWTVTRTFDFPPPDGWHTSIHFDNRFNRQWRQTALGCKPTPMTMRYESVQLAIRDLIEVHQAFTDWSELMETVTKATRKVAKPYKNVKPPSSR